MPSSRARVALALLALAAPLTSISTAEAAPFGERRLAEGMSGHDVRVLQRHLTRAGFPTLADGRFGRRTEQSLRRFERREGRRADGIVSRSDARSLTRTARPAGHGGATFRGRALTRPAQASLTSEGLAVAPASAPPAVVAAIEAGNRIATKPYKYGGGHGRWRDSGYDCSGSVSYALHAAGLLRSPLASTGFMSWGRPGRGSWITTYANGGHAYMVVAGLRFDTSARSRGGTRWTDERRSGRGFVKRHPAGL